VLFFRGRESRACDGRLVLPRDGLCRYRSEWEKSSDLSLDIKTVDIDDILIVSIEQS
jgi:hypothetical protein